MPKIVDKQGRDVIMPIEERICLCKEDPSEQICGRIDGFLSISTQPEGGECECSLLYGRSCRMKSRRKTLR